jgi:hypothetical protein
MSRLYKAIIFLFFSVQVYAQKNIFKLSNNEGKSFYGKEIVSLVNSQLKQYTRVKGDTAFVEINDFSENTFFDAFITVKRRSQSVYYYIFYNPHIDYFIVELSPNLIPTVNIKSIRTYLNDTSFIKEDTTIYVRSKNSCHFYLGIHKADKELSVWSTIFWKSNDGTFAYKQMVNNLYSYFSSDEPRGIRPSMIKKYKRVKLK